MGRLVPIFEETSRGKRFEGLFHDTESNLVGHLEVPSRSTLDVEGRARLEVSFVVEGKE